MPTLPELQKAFAHFMRSPSEDAACRHIVEDRFTAAERFDIYRNASRSTLTEALRITYPAVERLVGNDFFDAAAQRFIIACPPRSGCLNDYGERFAGFLADFAPASALPYLPDVARFEWALSVAANAVDAPVLDALALAAVDAHLHAALRFEAHPSVRFLALGYPADSIADAVLSGDEAAMNEIDLLSGPVWLVVHRGMCGVEAQRLPPDDYRFVRRLCSGEPLGSVLEAAPREAPALLAEQLAKGRLTAFRL